MEDDGLFDRSHIEDEPFHTLPPPLSPGQDLADPFGDGDNGDVSGLADVPEAKRKGVKRPQPKLDSNRLISDRGLPALRTLFNGVQFKGKGHEAEDLRSLMKRMENWAHRLFPKLQFEDFIDKVERLGAKKEVQTCLKRIRLDMPLTHDDYTRKEGDDEAPEDVQMFGDPDPFVGEHLSASPPRLVHSTPAPGGSAAHGLDLSPGSAPASGLSLTEEQRRRMEENRLKAVERRLAKHKPQQQESQTGGSQTGGSQTGGSHTGGSQTGGSQTGGSQTGGSQTVPMEESTEVSSEPAPSSSQVQKQIQEELDPGGSSSTTRPQENQIPVQDGENHMEPEPEKPEASPSPVPEPEDFSVKM